MGLVGADVDQLRALARTMTQAADRLDGVTTSVSSQLTSTRWVGHDAEQYRSQWQSESSGLIRSASVALRDAAAALERNAADQEQTSGAAGGGIVGGSGFGGLSVFSDGSYVTPSNGLVDIRDFLNTTPVWPIMWSTVLGPLDKIQALPLLDALGLASDSSLSPRDKMIQAQNSATDLAGGLSKGLAGKPLTVLAGLLKGKVPSSYVAGVAIQQWGDVVALAAKADFSPSGVKTVTDYIATNPLDAFDAAADAVHDYFPKIVANLVPW